MPNNNNPTGTPTGVKLEQEVIRLFLKYGSPDLLTNIHAVLIEFETGVQSARSGTDCALQLNWSNKQITVPPVIMSAVGGARYG